MSEEKKGQKKLSYQEILIQRESVLSMQKVSRFPISILLNNIRSMHNIGSIFRTADATCIKKVFITGYTALPPRKEIEKTALGATETVPWIYQEDPISCVNALKKKGMEFIALEQTKAGKTIYDYQMDAKKEICIVVGNEVFGIDNDLLACCDVAVEIPMYGMKHSLNVSVATGVVLFEFIRQLLNFE